MKTKTLGVLEEDYRKLIEITILLSVRAKRPVPIREAFGVVVKHFKGCKHDKDSI